jgi:hypothetical protein
LIMWITSSSKKPFNKNAGSIFSSSGNYPQ